MTDEDRAYDVRLLAWVCILIVAAVMAIGCAVWATSTFPV